MPATPDDRPITQLVALREFLFPGLCGLLTQQVSRLQGIDLPRAVFRTERGNAAPEANPWRARARIRWRCLATWRRGAGRAGDYGLFIGAGGISDAVATVSAIGSRDPMSTLIGR